MAWSEQVSAWCGQGAKLRMARRRLVLSCYSHSLIVIRTGLSISLGKDRKSAPRRQWKDSSSLMDSAPCHSIGYEPVHGALSCCDS